MLVNIPSQTLWAVDHGNVALEMPVIVGKPERATKIFVAEITGVRFNPKWTVPPTIKQNDMLTHLQEDPTYLEQKGIELSQTVDGHRETLDPSQIDWSQVTKAEINRMHMVQGAGDNNALGKVRVLMDNPYDIYLHDTSSPELFSKQERELSSGCIRMSNPEAMARFILDQPTINGRTVRCVRSLMAAAPRNFRCGEDAGLYRLPDHLAGRCGASGLWAGFLQEGQSAPISDEFAACLHIPEPQQPKFASIGVGTTYSLSH